MSEEKLNQSLLNVNQLEQYLSFLNVAIGDDTNRDLELLAKLQRTHVQTIVFNNAALVFPPAVAMYNRTISLQFSDVFEKVVIRRHGGYCFELNLLFAELLRALGFEIWTGAARVCRASPNNWTNFGLTHMIIFVELEKKRYLVDVGFAHSYAPFPIQVTEPLESEEAQRSLGLRLVKGPSSKHVGVPSGWKFQKYSKSQQEWVNEYFFQEIEYYPADFRLASFFVGNNSDHWMNQKFLAARDTDHGRITMFENELKIFSVVDDSVKVTKLNGNDEIAAVLEEHFSIKF
jgi:arylamine N-acetyltransferase